MRRVAAGRTVADAIRATVEDELAVRWPPEAVGLHALHRYALLPSGKLLRPLLICHSTLALGGRLEQVLPAAVGFECAHVGSLIHDDILDRDTTRRGKPAVHTAYGPEQAIVAGNALFFAWFSALAECADHGIGDRQIRRALAIQARAGTEACLGVLDEIILSCNPDSSVDAYLAMARRKTAVLLSAACEVGAILADSTAEQQARLAAFGEHFGLAFQIRDDLLPYSEPVGHGGKPPDSDLRNHRLTLPVLLALQRADRDTRQTIRSLLSSEPSEPGAHHEFGRLLSRSGAIAGAERIADHHIAVARKALNGLPSGPHKEALHELTIHGETDASGWR